MKKINELVTNPKKTEQKPKRASVSFGSFKRAEDKQIAETKKRKHEEELARIAEEARIANEIKERKARIDREVREEEERVIKEENKRIRSEFITKSMSNAFGTKTDIDFKPVREKVIDKYLPQLREQETLDDYPKPFEAEPALNAELAEFKKKINEHLHKVGFMGSGGGGAGSFSDLDDVDPTTAKVDGKTIQFDGSTNKFVGADVTANALAADNLTAGDAAINLTTTSGNITIDAQGSDTDIIFKGTDGSSDTTFLTIDGSEAGAATFNAGIVIADAGNIGSASDTDAIAIASNGVVTFSQAPVFPDGSIAVVDLDIDGGTDVGADLVDADLVIVDDGAGGTNRKSELTRIKKYIFSALSGDATASDAGALTIANTSIENGMLAGSIANDKLSNSSITVSDGSSTTAVSLGGTITFSATTNETTVSESSGTITIGLPNDVTIAGDLTVNGDTVTVNTATLSVEDPFIKLANGNNSADSVDIGFYGLYDTSGSQDLYAGLFRDANDSGKFKLFKDLQVEPTTTVNTGGTGYAVGTLVANIEGDVTGDVTGNVSGTAATVTGAAQSNITSLGTLTTLTVDNIIINGTNIGHTSDTDAMAISSGGVVTFSQVPLFPADTVETADIQDNAVTPAKIAGAVNAQTGTTYTLVIGDAFKTVTMNNSSSNTLTIPPNSSVAFAVGDRIDVVMLGSGTTTVTGGSGVTVNGVSTGSGAIAAQYASASCLKIATNTWLLIGNHGGVS